MHKPDYNFASKACQAKMTAKMTAKMNSKDTKYVYFPLNLILLDKL
jgi:hypothetical protein